MTFTKVHFLIIDDGRLRCDKPRSPKPPPCPLRRPESTMNRGGDTSFGGGEWTRPDTRPVGVDGVDRQEGDFSLFLRIQCAPWGTSWNWTYLLTYLPGTFRRGLKSDRRRGHSNMVYVIRDEVLRRFLLDDDGVKYLFSTGVFPMN